ncbi:DUF1365 domain-containing protein [Aliidiomarina sanyensis]|uniref:DUF1365 domain-containing protein n=1 Tax=Aliidiomarina sanyensis TaxID=1249555 RepID=A0A432WS46_9GAMM|nr:DUF1365 domain-containing protein [Aliidiomarina sanyensis]RUO36593.1 DUF1365 domain-containing protein [Aliidiomarina sanyensis]
MRGSSRLDSVNSREVSADSTHEHAIYWGAVRHRRFVPKSHHFHYSVMQWWFHLDDLASADGLSRLLSTSRKRAVFQFNPQDYLRGQRTEPNQSLANAVRAKMSALAGTELTGDVFFLGNIRCFGLFFSPINCYYLRNEAGVYSHMLAEVSNTPWNERHYYLLDLEHLADHAKAFHVSPFNPMNMRYHWRLTLPKQEEQSPILVHIGCHTDEKDFDATLTGKRQSLNRAAIQAVLRKHPWMSLKIVAGIYWQALKLFIKRVPFYGHPGSAKSQDVTLKGKTKESGKSTHSEDTKL